MKWVISVFSCLILFSCGENSSSSEIREKSPLLEEATDSTDEKNDSVFYRTYDVSMVPAAYREIQEKLRVFGDNAQIYCACLSENNGDQEKCKAARNAASIEMRESEIKQLNGPHQGGERMKLLKIEERIEECEQYYNNMWLRPERLLNLGLISVIGFRLKNNRNDGPIPILRNWTVVFRIIV